MVIDITSFIQATSREVTTRTKNGEEMRAVIVARDYPTDQTDLWNALTDINRIPRWFLPITGDLKLGGRYQFEGNAGGEVLECEPTSRFNITWEFGGAMSWVEVTLTAVPGGTRLLLEHTSAVPEEMWKQYGPGAVGIGWESGLYGMARHINGEPSLSPAEAMAWMGSPEGKEFIRGTSDKWCQASVDSGTPETEALEAATRCAAAYMGEA